MRIIQGRIFDLLLNNGMSCVLMKVHSTNSFIKYAVDKIRKTNPQISLNSCFIDDLSEEFPMDSKTSSDQPR